MVTTTGEKAFLRIVTFDWIVDWLSDLYCYGCGQNEDDNCEIEVLQCNCVIRNFKNLIEKDGNEDGSN
jgi:hypothetical protein